MATTNVLLREDVESLGGRGDIVKVKAGYARNYLLPRKLAVEATTSNVRQIEQERAALLRREARERGSAEAQAAEMSKLRLNFERRVGEHGILYGSVTSMDITEALKERGYEVDRRRVLLREPIKEVGDFTVAVRLHRDVTVEVPITVTPEGATNTVATGATETAASTQAEASDTTQASGEETATMGTTETTEITES